MMVRVATMTTATLTTRRGRRGPGRTGSTVTVEQRARSTDVAVRPEFGPFDELSDVTHLSDADLEAGIAALQETEREVSEVRRDVQFATAAIDRDRDAHRHP